MKTGDIVEHTGGYNCTQTQFYVIVEMSKTGKKAVVQRLNATQTSGDWMNGAVAPVPGTEHGDKNTLTVKASYSGETILRGRINHTVIDKETGEVKWVNKGSIENFYKWNGKPIWNNCD